MNKLSNIDQVKKKGPRRRVNVKILIVLALLFLLVPILLWLFFQVIYPGIEASPAEIPESIKITDVTSNSFAVSWTTLDNTLGYVKYGSSPGSLSSTAYDARGSSGKYHSHYVTIKDLSPTSTYYFKLVSENSEYDSGGTPYDTQTFSVLELPTTLDTLMGVAKDAGGNPLADALVYLTLVGKGAGRETVSHTAGTVTASSGGWVFNLSVRNVAGSSFVYNVDDYYAKIDVVAAGQPAGTVVGSSSGNFGDVAVSQNSDDMENLETVATQGGSGGTSGGTGGSEGDDASVTIKNLEVTNISDGAFSIVWETDEATAGKIEYGKDAALLGDTVGDDRGETRKLYSHSATIVDTASDPGTTYYYEIGGETYSFSKPAESSVPRTDLALGEIASDTGELDDAVIVAQVQVPGVNATSVSAVPQSNGNWTLELGYTRGENGGVAGDYVSYDDSDDVSITVLGALGVTSFTTTVAELKQGDYTIDVSLKEKDVVETCLPIDLSSGVTLEAGDTITGCTPSAGSEVEITMESPVTVEDTATSDASGLWAWEIPEDTPTGWHTITVQVTGSDGSVETVEREVYVQGAQVPQTGIELWWGPMAAGMLVVIGLLVYVAVQGKDFEQRSLGLFE